VLERRKSPYPATQDHAYEEALRGQLTALLARRDSPVLPLLDRDRVRALTSGTGAGHDEMSRAPIEQALLLDRWLDRYKIQLAI
jgi:asparagine synthase (glutamine-hydrolysing)